MNKERRNNEAMKRRNIEASKRCNNEAMQHHNKGAMTRGRARCEGQKDMGSRKMQGLTEYKIRTGLN